MLPFGPETVRSKTLSARYVRDSSHHLKEVERFYETF